MEVCEFFYMCVKCSQLVWKKRFKLEKSEKREFWGEYFDLKARIKWVIKNKV
jgi:hypothetical protein